MTQLPLLVNNLIDWYIWKAKIKACNKEYCIKIPPFNQYRAYYWTITSNDNIKILFRDFQYRNLRDPGIQKGKHKDYYIYNFTFIDDPVAHLPQRYFFSSGKNHMNGYFNYIEKYAKIFNTMRSNGKKVNSWVFRH
ncbi:MAG: hypothetical protein WD512_12335 [Candidatus Paceibacterota bacterium]